MSDTDLIKLYSGRILELASSLTPFVPLDAPQGKARARSPLCGSTVAVELSLDNEGRIADYSQDVKACALGQASAAILAGVAPGRSLKEISGAKAQLEAMLKTDGPIPYAPFEGYEVLIPARAYKNRHASILLALEATETAMREASA